MPTLVDPRRDTERGLIILFVLALAIGFVVIAADEIERPVHGQSAEASDVER